MARKQEPLTADQRTMIAKIGAYALHAKYGKEITEAATHASQVTRFEQQVDPDGLLSPEERRTRAMAARRAYMRGLALKRSRRAQAERAAKQAG